MERNVREKRMKMLNDYMRILLQLSVIKSHPMVQSELLTFLEPEYDKGGPSGQLAKTVRTRVRVSVSDYSVRYQ